jgi:hypothetical protein
VQDTALKPARIPRELVAVSHDRTTRAVPIEELMRLAADESPRPPPVKSDIHEIVRAPQEKAVDPDSALGDLVSAYEDRVERLEKERARLEAIIAKANINPDAPQPKPIPRSQVPTEKTKKKSAATPVNRAMAKLQPHLWTIIFSTICVWGLLQLVFTR